MKSPDINRYFKRSKLLNVVVQDTMTQEVICLERMDKTSYKKTITEQKLYIYDTQTNKAIQKRTKNGKSFRVQDLHVNPEGQVLVQVRVPEILQTPWGRDNSKCFCLQKFNSYLEQGKLKSKKGWSVSQMINKGEMYLAKKVSEEAVEFSLAAVDQRSRKSDVLEEGADLLYYIFILSHVKGICFSEIVEKLYQRQSKNSQ